MLNEEQFILRASAAKMALAEVAQRERATAQEKAMLWLELAASAFSLLPDEFSAWARLSWSEEHGPRCEPMILCPAGSVFAYEALITKNAWDDQLLMSRPRGDLVLVEMINERDLIPAAPLRTLRVALREAEEALMGFLTSSISAAPIERGQDSWFAQARGKQLLDASALANALGMPEAAAFWEARQMGQAATPAKAFSARPKPL